MKKSLSTFLFYTLYNSSKSIFLKNGYCFVGL